MFRVRSQLGEKVMQYNTALSYSHSVQYTVYVTVLALEARLVFDFDPYNIYHMSKSSGQSDN